MGWGGQAIDQKFSVEADICAGGWKVPRQGTSFSLGDRKVILSCVLTENRSYPGEGLSELASDISVMGHLPPSLPLGMAAPLLSLCGSPGSCQECTFIEFSSLPPIVTQCHDGLCGAPIHLTTSYCSGGYTATLSF